ncbi:MAG: NAD(P)/FAD-dependent oxidoreductase [Chloroflexi bacterium]|nr:NAD(P)/FAD-dependent oxidoreductase [Chloroflexota bacterium]
MRIVILGAGFGGLNAALELERRLRRHPEVEIALVDRHPYSLFTPMLYQAATGAVEPGHLAYPLRGLRRRRLDFYEAEVRRIDLAGCQVITEVGELAYDHLLIALGSVNNFFGVPKAESFALPMKTLREAMAIKYRILEMFRRADLEPREAERRQLLSFAVVGGGANGVEVVASLYDLAHKVLARDYPRLNPHEIAISLIEASPGLLAGVDTRLGALALRKLQALGIPIYLNTRIVGIDQERIHTAEGKHIPVSTVIWATGIRPNPLLEPLPARKARDGRLEVAETFEVPLWHGVWAVGDNAFLLNPKTGQPLACTAQVATQQGVAVGRNIARAVLGESPQPFRFQDQGDLVALGRNASLARLGGRCFNGFPAWLVWRLAHLWKLPGFRNQVSVALDWTFDYVFQRDTARIE